jgi:putative spermidine/putrescine transport system permease protein
MGSLNGINPHFEAAAMSLGANRTRTFLHVVLPLSIPGVAGAFLIVFSIAISAYATPAILGGPATLVAATAIYNFIIQLLDWSLGSALAVILIASSLLLLYAAGRLGTRRATL